MSEGRLTGERKKSCGSRSSRSFSIWYSRRACPTSARCRCVWEGTGLYICGGGGFAQEARDQYLDDKKLSLVTEEFYLDPDNSGSDVLLFNFDSLDDKSKQATFSHVKDWDGLLNIAEVLLQRNGPLRTGCEGCIQPMNASQL